jgi:chemotaxis protein methyltransferase CheR
MMTNRINDQLLSQISEFVTARFGLHFPRKRWRDLERGIVCAAVEFGFKDAALCSRWLISTQLNRSQLDILAGCLTIGETYFFREPNSFDALETQILPALISSRRGKEQRLRIWSAGCSTGEEAYSIAILLQRLIADVSQWNITILATDVNPASLHKAVLGEYRDWSFRGIPHGIIERYFTRNGEGRFEIAAAIRKMVTFAPLNLAEDPYPSLTNNTNAMDVIFCRNVLMYFTPHRMKKAVENFSHSLVAGGWLIVSPCEASHTLFPQFEAVHFRNAILYRKDGQRIQPAAAAFPGAANGTTAPLPSPAIKLGIPQPPLFAPPLAQVFSAAVAVPEAAGPRISPYEEALALYRQGLYAEAQTTLSGLLSNVAADAGQPVPEEAAVLLARLFANQGDFTKALEWTEKAVAVNKLDPEARYLEAIIFQEQGAVDAAVAALKKTLYLDHTFVLAHFALANLIRQRGRVKEAARHLENAASLLATYGDDDILPGSEGLSARRLGEIIVTTRESIAK